MISYAEAPVPAAPDPVDDHILSLAHTITEAHQKHIDDVFTAAILNNNEGVRPSDDELRQWCRKYVMGDGTVLLTWKAPESGMLDMNYVIARVPPPTIL